MATNTLQGDRLAALRRQLQVWEGGHHQRSDAEGTVIPSGIPCLDAVMPRGGLKGHELIEWFFERPGSGAGRLAFTVAERAANIAVDRGYGRVIVVVDPDRIFYPPAVGGVDPRGIIIIRPRNLTELIWAWHQSLHSTAVAAVWGSVPRIDPRDFRRLQLAAEQGHTLGLLLRSTKLQRDPSWAHIRLLVTPGSPPRLLRSP